MVGAFTQASVRSSAAILGVAFVENICGDAGMAPLMIASAVPFFNVLSVVILVFSADMGKYSDSPDSSLKNHEESSDKKDPISLQQLHLWHLLPSEAASVIKLIALPALFIPVAVKLGFTGSELVAILIMLASPTTVTCYIMAKAMQNDEVLTSNVVVITTLLSSVTLTLWVFILKSLALI